MEWVIRRGWFVSLLFAGSVALAPPLLSQIVPGDILVADFEGGAEGAGLLFLVHADGSRIALSDFDDPGQGPLGQSPFDVTIADPGTILVLDNQGLSGSGTLFQVDPVSGVRTIVSDFSNAAQGPIGVDPVGIVQSAAGALMVVDKDAGSAKRGALFEINPTSGTRTILSDFGNPAQGPLGENPTGIARGAGGVLLVVDPDGGTDENGALLAVDPVTGFRTSISDFGDAGQGPVGVNPGDVALGGGGQIWVPDTEAGTGGLGVLFSVDAATGVRTVRSSFGNLAQGAAGADPFFVAVGGDGGVLVSDYNGGTDIPLDGYTGGNGGLFKVNPTNGNRTLLSDFGNPAQGATGVDPDGIVVVPRTRSGDALVVSPFTGSGGSGELVSVDPATGSRVVVSDFGNAWQGPTGNDPIDIAPGMAGDVWIADALLGGSNGALFRVDPRSGVRSLISNFNSAAQGPTGGPVRGVHVEADGSVLAIAANAGTGARGALYRVDPTTGMRILLSDLGDPAQGPLGLAPDSVAVETDGTILVIDPDAVTIGTNVGILFRVDPVTGDRTVLSDFNSLAQGLPGKDPIDVTPESGGTILVSDINASQVASSFGMLFRVSPTTGNRTVLSDFGNAATGPTGPNSQGVDATDEILVVDNAAGTGGVGALFQVDATSGLRTMLSDFGDAAQGPTGARPFGVMLYLDAGAACAAPSEVQQLTLGRSASPAGTRLSWAAADGADAYAIYRASAADLSDAVCLYSGVTATETIDESGDPSTGEIHHLLVTAVGCGGESILGFRSDGSLRTSAAACP